MNRQIMLVYLSLGGWEVVFIYICMVFRFNEEYFIIIIFFKWVIQEILEKFYLFDFSMKGYKY